MEKKDVIKINTLQMYKICEKATAESLFGDIFFGYFCRAL